MRVSVEITEAQLAEARRFTGEKVKSRAIAKAVDEYIRHSKAVDFTARAAAGEFADWFDFSAFDEMKGADQAEIHYGNTTPPDARPG